MTTTLTRRVPWWVLILLTAVTYVLDLLSKQWALSALADGQYHPVIGGLLGFELVFNPGAAFSFLTNATWVFTIVGVVVALIIVWMWREITSWSWAWTLTFLLGGTLGNLTDRFFRAPGVGVGHVVDFINYNGFFVGNVADIFIVLAAVGISVLAFKGTPLAEPPGARDE